MQTRCFRIVRFLILQRYVSACLAGLLMLAASPLWAQDTFDPTFSVGGGIQTSYAHIETDGLKDLDQFTLDHARLYFSGDVTKNFSVMINTDYDSVSDNMQILDAVGEFHMTPKFDIWFGRFITEPKPWLKSIPRARRLSLIQFKSRLRRVKSLVWHPAVHAAWFDTRRACHLFVDGAHHPLPAALRQLTRALGDRRRFETDFLLRYADHETAGPLLLQFLNAGQLKWR